jgi:hypothetical protein
MCILQFDYVLSQETSSARLAQTLVHEAMHARLYKMGIAYDEALRARVEHLCVQAEVALAQRLPGGAELVAAATARLNRDAEFYTNAAFRVRGERALERMGWPGRVGAAVGRVLRWLEERRAA